MDERRVGHRHDGAESGNALDRVAIQNSTRRPSHSYRICFISMIAMTFIMYKNQEPLASMSRYEYFSRSYSQFNDPVHHFLSSLLQSLVCNFTSLYTYENATSIDTTYLANTTPSALLAIFSPTFPSRVIIPQKFTISACMH